MTTKEPRIVKKLTIEITDQDAIAAAYPEVMETKPVVNRKKLRVIVNAMYGIGRQVDGVKAYYASEAEKAKVDAK